jgi:hypothetical protein
MKSIKSTNGIILILLCLLCFSARGQTSTLYLLGAKVNPVGTGSAATLYRINTERTSLTLVRTIVPEEDSPDGVRIDYENRVISLNSSIAGLSIIQMDKPFESLQVAINPENRHIHLFPLLETPGKGSIQALHMIGPPRNTRQVDHLLAAGNQGERLEGVYLSGPLLGKQVSLSMGEYVYIRVNGAPGGALRGDGAFFRIFDHNLEVNESATEKQAIITDGSVPEAIDQYPNYDVQVVSKDFICLTQPGLKDVNSRMPDYSVLHIYDRNQHVWSKVRLAGTAPAVRSFGTPWIGIIETDSSEPEAYTRNRTPGGPRPRRPEFRDSPGLREGDGKENEVRLAVRDWYRRKASAYYPGRLTVYNLATEAKFEIETNEGDSEVLFANDSTVDYRVFDQIFRASIIGKALDLPELIAKGPEIVNVHWAFLGAPHD